jgi:hypothetical protein
MRAEHLHHIKPNQLPMGVIEAWSEPANQEG